MPPSGRISLPSKPGGPAGSSSRRVIWPCPSPSSTESAASQENVLARNSLASIVQPSPCFRYTLRIPHSVHCAESRVQRLKGAIDSRIAEEQARQRQAAQQSQGQHPARSSSLRRSNSNALSPAGRRPRTPDLSGDKPPVRGPDPAEFDPDVVVGEDELSRSTTPRPPNDKDDSAQQQSTENGDAAKGDKEDAEAARDAKSAASTASNELPTEVRVRLRKLEKLEPKYSGISLLPAVQVESLTRSQNCYAHTASPTPVSPLLSPSKLP